MAAAAVLLLGGCGGGDSGAADGPDDTAPATAEGGEERGGDSSSGRNEPPVLEEEREYSVEEQDRLGEPVPDEELTGSQDREFTPEEREYLGDQVPDGAEPGAVLEAGKEACDRVARLARQDQDGAVEALRDGEPAGAAEAIPALCPEYQDLLDATTEQ